MKRRVEGRRVMMMDHLDKPTIHPTHTQNTFINIKRRRRRRRRKDAYDGVLGFLSRAGAFAQDLVVTFLVYSALAHCEKKKQNKNNKTKDENKQRERKEEKKEMRRTSAAARRKEGSMWHSLTHRPPLNFGSFGC